MHAEKLMLETDATGQFTSVPKLQGNRRYEAIFLEVGESRNEAATVARRQPHPALRSAVTVRGNVIDAVPASDWNLPT